MVEQLGVKHIANTFFNQFNCFADALLTSGLTGCCLQWNDGVSHGAREHDEEDDRRAEGLANRPRRPASFDPRTSSSNIADCALPFGDRSRGLYRRASHERRAFFPELPARASCFKTTSDVTPARPMGERQAPGDMDHSLIEPYLVCKGYSR